MHTKNLWFFFLLACVSFHCQAKIITTIFGDIDENREVILKLIDSKAMQRLKDIDQSGPTVYFSKGVAKFSRYDHSLGVYALLKRYNAPLNEQVAGLLHDASHTAFSHLGDLIFQKGEQRTESYQDSIHDWALRQLGVEETLQQHRLKLTDVSPKNPNFLALEQPYPDMNADRIEYNLHTALAFNDLTREDVEGILSALKYANNKWYFTSITQAKKFAKLSTYYNKAFWGSLHNQAMYSVATAIMKHGLQRKVINANDLHFSTDEQLLSKLRADKSVEMSQLLTVINQLDKHFTAGDSSDYHIFARIKMRGIDPLVLHENKLQRLSAISKDFASELELTQEYCKRGAYIKFINLPSAEVLQMIVVANSAK